MNLYEDYYKDYYIMNQSTVDDSEGGYLTGWTPGARIKMALDEPTQTQRLVAGSNRLEVAQNAIFPRNAPVRRGTYLRRADDEAEVYLVQTNPTEAPGRASMDVKKAEVIRSRLPA